MTHRLNNLSRRNMFALTAGGASALAVGGLLGRTASAATPQVTPLSDAQLPQALVSVPGDLQLDPAAGALAQKLLARLKKSVLDVATRSGEVDNGDKVAAASRNLVDSLRKARVNRLQVALKPGSKFKEVAELSKAEPSQAHKMYDFELSEFVAKYKKKPKLTKKKKEEPQWQGPLAQKIEFHLNSVKCLDTTSGPGSDEILLGGSIVTPGGVVKKIDGWKVADGFDDGDRVFYDYSRCKDFPANTPKFIIDATCPRGNPNDVYAGRKIAFTRLNIDIPWPATIAVLLTMGEQDSGGFNQLIQDGYAALEQEIKKKLAELGVQAGTAIGGELGAVIGAVIAAVLGEFLDWLVSLFNTVDDFIGTKTWTVQLDSPEMSAIRAKASGGLPSPAGTTASKMKKLTFTGDGGKYEARLHWRVHG